MATPGFWQIWIDTGGTFTDCLAISPDGTRQSAKVLSHSALRALARPAGDAFTWTIEAPWRVPAGFFGAARARTLGSAGGDAAVVDFDPATGTLRLAERLPLTAASSGDERIALELRFPEEPPLLAARLVTGTASAQALPPILMRLATTRGTNALLERRGAATALFITAGFADLLEIGNQQRTDLFALEVKKTRPLYAAVCEVRGRLSATGEVLSALDPEALGADARAIAQGGVRSAAVALMHAYLEPRHEREVREVLRTAGFERVSLSSDLAPRLGLLVRAQTAVVDAYLAPVVGGYLERVAAGLTGGRLHVMNSAGGLLDRSTFRAKDSLLSGPAGGVVGAVAAARRSGIDELVAFDMGGTSTDVSRFAGRFEYTFEHAVGDATIAAPALRVETVAAGGGSICTSDGHALLVGPQSAGADPGPACYGAGGPLTLTDVNLLLGRLVPERFGIPLDTTAAERALAAVADRFAADPRHAAPSAEELLEGFLRIANERMADAIRRISVREGYDPRAAALVAFGGAGGQHACAVADLLGMSRVLVPRDASLLSARGLGVAVFERFAEEQVLRELDDPSLDVVARLEALGDLAVEDVRAQGGEHAAVTRRLVFLRLAGQDATVPIELDGEPPTAGALAAAFAVAYRGIYGYPAPARALEVESLRVVAASPSPALDTVAADPGGKSAAAELERRRSCFDGIWREVAVYEREALRAGRVFQGPCLIVEAHSATVVDQGWLGFVDGGDALLLERRAAPADAGSPPEPG